MFAAPRASHNRDDAHPHRRRNIMSNKIYLRCRLAGLAGLLLAVVIWPPTATAQTATVFGEATALRATTVASGLLGLLLTPTTTELAATGGLTSLDDLLAAELLDGGIEALGGADALHAATGSSIDGWNAGDAVASDASL